MAERRSETPESEDGLDTQHNGSNQEQNQAQLKQRARDSAFV